MSRRYARALVYPAPNHPPEIRRYPIPDLEPGAVLLRVLASEICGTDVHLFHGRLQGVPYPLIPGHVSVGIVEEKNGAVYDVEGRPINLGDRVTFLDVHATCNNCWYCLVAKATTRCPHRRVYGITYGAEDPPGLAGGWSEYLYLRPNTKLLHLPTEVSAATWMGGGCGLPTATHAIELAQIRLADRVLIQGSGPVGLSCAALALLSGAGWVGVVGAPELRLQLARRFGVDATFNIQTTTLQERQNAIKSLTGNRGPDVVIEASGNPQAILEGCELVRDGGRYVIVGQYTDNGDILINPHLHINRKHLEIRGCWGSDFSHFYRAIEILKRFESRIHWSHFISRSYQLDEVPKALEDVEQQRVIKALITPNGPIDS
ncbi:theronine dehydrogenase-like Zn-dependent dehydrogenase [Chthonomonas calidirosea]|uniref:zinc-binding dehydrogenase n=1 Tax=Chthonomonas calidirosea TaxID=454171 RepID=UPI0006DD4C4F|nr:zinc-binding dehydrogenase [Chthonomonas calidirosea]CEK14073.1 theronine dehydrogenase-like Zn-dependent dehydrogenase [Chthonomonas calidirosea]